MREKLRNRRLCKTILICKFQNCWFCFWFWFPFTVSGGDLETVESGDSIFRLLLLMWTVRQCLQILGLNSFPPLSSLSFSAEKRLSQRFSIHAPLNTRAVQTQTQRGSGDSTQHTTHIQIHRTRKYKTEPSRHNRQQTEEKDNWSGNNKNNNN